MKRKWKQGGIIMLVFFFSLLTAGLGKTTTAQATAMIADGYAGNIYWIFDTDGVLSFEGTGTFGSFTKYSVPWREYISDIERVVFGMNEVEGGEISHYFSGCTNLKYVNHMPKGIHAMESTFEKCEALVSVGNIPETVTNMNEAFRNCKKLNCEITIPSRVEKAYAAFMNCSSLTHTPQILSDSIENMGYMFQNTAILLPPRLPAGAKYLQHTFYDCTKLKECPVVPNSVENMKGTFQRCYEIMKPCMIPENVKDMSYCFSECIFMVGTPIIASRKLENMAYAFYKCQSMAAAPMIPSSVTDLSYAFWKCEDMAHAPDIPARVKKMSHCLAECTRASGTMTIYAVIEEKENYTCFAGETAIYDINSSSALFLGGRGSGLTINYVNNNKNLVLSYLSSGWNCGSLGNYGEHGTLKLGTKVTQRLSECDIEIPEPQVYTGKPIRPELNITYAGIPLTKGTDYTAVYTNYQNAGTASVYIEGMKEYQGALNVTYTIKKASFEKAKAYDYEGIFDGKQHGITVVADKGARVEYGLQEGQYTTEECPVFELPGQYTVYVQVSKENYETWTGQAQIRIQEASLSIQSQGFSGGYDGHPHSISVTADEGAKVMYGSTSGQYTLSSPPSYVNAGRYTVYYEVKKIGYKTVTGYRMVIIQKKQIDAIEFPQATDIIVGNPLNLSALDFIANPYGTFVWEKSGVILPVGTYSEILIFTPSDMYNYDFSLVDGYQDLDGRVKRAVSVNVVIEPPIEPEPTVTPTLEPAVEPTVKPDEYPTLEPTARPTVEPTIKPSLEQSPEVSNAPQPMYEPGEALLTDEEQSEEQLEIPTIFTMIRTLAANETREENSSEKIKKPARVRQVKVKRKKNKLQIKWKKIPGDIKYQIQIKAPKATKKKFVRKSILFMKGKRWQQARVKVRAYVWDGQKRVYGSWSKEQRVK